MIIVVELRRSTDGLPVNHRPTCRNPGWDTLNASRNIIRGFPQQLELTLPWGMDDGDAVVRLTLAPPPSTELGKRGVLAVVVFAEAVRFGEPLSPPHSPGHDRPVIQPRAVPPLITSVAEYLGEQTHGGPTAAVGDGSVRFVLSRFPTNLDSR